MDANIIELLEEHNEPIKLKSGKIEDRGIFSCAIIGNAIIYNDIMKKFIPTNSVKGNHNAFLGWMINYETDTNLVNVLYRGFLLKDPLKFTMTLKPRYIQTYIQDSFNLATQTIIDNMPRIKKLKRLNLKMITKEHALFIHYNLDTMCRYYEQIYSYIEAQKLKAQIATSPFYVNDNGIIKLYNFQTNELTIPDLESEGFFLAYFTFKNKTN